MRRFLLLSLFLSFLLPVVANASSVNYYPSYWGVPNFVNVYRDAWDNNEEGTSRSMIDTFFRNYPNAVGDYYKLVHRSGDVNFLLVLYTPDVQYRLQVVGDRFAVIVHSPSNIGIITKTRADVINFYDFSTFYYDSNLQAYKLNLNSVFGGYNPIYPDSWVKLSPPDLIGFMNITVDRVTSSSVTISWPHPPEVTEYRYRLTSLVLPPDGIMGTVVRSGDRQTLEITGLKPKTGYTVYVLPLVNGNPVGREAVKSFWTRDDRQDLVVYMAGVQLQYRADNRVATISDLILDVIGYDRLDVFGDGQLVKTLQQVTDGQYTLYKSEFQSLTDDDYVNFEIRAYRNGKIVQVYNFGVQGSNFSAEPGSVTDYGPRPPDKPDNAWDILGWIRYGFGWVTYLVESVTWVINRVGSLISGLFGSVSSLAGVFASFFGFLPSDITAILVLGVTIVLALRILGR